MSRTNKKPTKYPFRNPRGHKSSKINIDHFGMRKNSLVPSAYDDINYDPQCHIDNRIKKMFIGGNTVDEIYHKYRNKKIKHYIIKDILDSIFPKTLYIEMLGIIGINEYYTNIVHVDNIGKHTNIGFRCVLSDIFCDEIISVNDKLFLSKYYGYNDTSILIQINNQLFIKIINTITKHYEDTGMMYKIYKVTKWKLNWDETEIEVYK